MAFDGLVTKAVISELNNSIIGSKVNKIFQPTKNEIIIGLYGNGINYLLNVCVHPELCRICLTTHSKPNPQNALNFCMLLRKYLIGSKIISISSYDLERTIEIKFECFNEFNDLVIRKLFVEIMSRQSNIILTNENNIIIDSLLHLTNSTRELLPAHEYTFMPNNKISFLELNDFNEFLEKLQGNNDNLIKKLPNTFIGFSKSFIKETLHYLNVDSSSYSNSDLENIYNYIKTIISNFGTNNLAVNFFWDDFYFQKEQENIFLNSRNNLLKIISANLKKTYKKLENINSKIEECKFMDTYKLYGELLTANLYKLSSMPHTNKVTLENYYDNNTLIDIPLDNSISVQQNIEKYFKKYNKLKNSLEIVTLHKQETTKELDYAESIIFSIENAKSINNINEIYEEISDNIEIKFQSKKPKSKSKKKTINLENTTVSGYTVFIGKNNIQNDFLTLKFAEKEDIWFHTQKFHGSHVLLKTNGETDIEDDVLIECAKIAMQNSKASQSSNVPVDYCFAKFVKKVAGSKPRNGGLHQLQNYFCKVKWTELTSLHKIFALGICCTLAFWPRMYFFHAIPTNDLHLYNILLEFLITNLVLFSLAHSCLTIPIYSIFFLHVYLLQFLSVY